jgi:hypothetical protein
VAYHQFPEVEVMRIERNSRWIQARYLLSSPLLFWGFWGQLYAHKLVVVKTTSAICGKNHKLDFNIHTEAPFKV